MSKLTAICGKLKEEVVLKGFDGVELKIDLLPPKVEDLTEISKVFKSKKEGEELTIDESAEVLMLAKRLFKQSLPDATEQEIDEVFLLNFNAVTKAVLSLIQKSFNQTEKK